MSSNPRLTSPKRTHSARVTVSRNSPHSIKVIKAGKLAKPSVAIAMPPTLTEIKNVTQCTASSTPEPIKAHQRPCCHNRLRGCASKTRPSKASASTAKPARPQVIKVGSAVISSPKMPVAPNSTATRCTENNDRARLKWWANPAGLPSLCRF